MSPKLTSSLVFAPQPFCVILVLLMLFIQSNVFVVASLLYFFSIFFFLSFRCANLLHVLFLICFSFCFLSFWNPCPCLSYYTTNIEHTTQFARINLRIFCLPFADRSIENCLLMLINLCSDKKNKSIHGSREEDVFFRCSTVYNKFLLFAHYVHHPLSTLSSSSLFSFVHFVFLRCSYLDVTNCERASIIR